MKLTSSGLTHVGMKRSHNEDCLRIYRDENLFIVADGMGGHASGEVASEMSADTLAAFYRATSLDEELTWPYKYDYTQTYEENRIRVGVQLSNQRIYGSAVYDAKLKGMGTTIVAVSFYERSFSIGHVGDSRVYLFRDQDIRQVTEDHSLLNDYIKMHPRGMTPEEIEAFPHKNVIVRALGMKERVQVDVITEGVQKGDLFLLCSDGLSGMLTDEEMTSIISQAIQESGDLFQVDLDQLCVQLINAANRNGGNDNITILIVRCDVLEGGVEIQDNDPDSQFKPLWLKEKTDTGTSEFYSQPQIGQMMKQPIDQTMEQPIDQTMEQPIDQTMDQPIDQTMDQDLHQTVDQTLEDPIDSMVPSTSDQKTINQQRGPVLDLDFASPTIKKEPIQPKTQSKNKLPSLAPLSDDDDGDRTLSVGPPKF